ncbi:MAG: cytochrome b [Rhodospirillales bacterium]|nr:cytochrome b [Rhodospirillales bacterium]
MSENSDQYNLAARVFHWGMALLIFGALIAGFIMTDMPRSPTKFEIYGVHKSVGVLILTLGFMRLIWRFMGAYPASLPTHAQWEKFLAKTIHIVLYISIFVMPLSGLVMSMAGGHDVGFFGLFKFPQFVGKNPELSEVAEEVHEACALILVGALGLHVAGALKHHFIDRDTTVARMGGNPVFGVIGILLTLTVLYFGVEGLAELLFEGAPEVPVETSAVQPPAE